MSIASDRWIRYMATNHAMLVPFADHQVSIENGEKIVSYGLSSYGYDIRCGRDFILAVGTDNELHLTDKDMIKVQPMDMVLAVSMERIKVPRSCLGICIGKSSYARKGLICNITPLEPEWEGYLTIELSNTGPAPINVYAGQGIAQLIFHRANDSDICEVSYADKKGKYQNQGPQPQAAK